MHVNQIKHYLHKLQNETIAYYHVYNNICFQWVLKAYIFYLTEKLEIPSFQ